MTHAGMSPQSVPVLDIDGTLVDTNYHHAIAWFRAFCRHGIVLPIWRVHRHIGMGGDEAVKALTDERTEQEQSDDIRGRRIDQARARPAVFESVVELCEKLDATPLG